MRRSGNFEAAAVVTTACRASKIGIDCDRRSTARHCIACPVPKTPFWWVTKPRCEKCGLRSDFVGNDKATLPWSIPSHWEYSFPSSLGTQLLPGGGSSLGAGTSLGTGRHWGHSFRRGSHWGGLSSGTLPLALTIRRQLDFRGQTPGEAGTLGRNIGGALGGGSTGDTASKKTAWYIRDAAGGKHHETRNSICNEMMQICNT